MNIRSHYQEHLSPYFQNLYNKHVKNDLKTNLWNAFVDSNLSGINEDDCTIFPRILPGSYLPVIEKVSRELSLFSLRFLSLPEKEIRAILPEGPIRDFLIDDLQVLKYRNGRITGSFRFDMAIVGEPEKENPPKLLELNEIGFDGLARSSFIQKTMLEIMPELGRHVFALDTAKAEAQNMRRLGKKIARFQYDSYNWEEEVLIQKAKAEGVDVRMISPKQFRAQPGKEEPLLLKENVALSKGRIKIGSDYYPDGLQMGFSYELSDYKMAAQMYRDIVRSKTPMYGSFLTGLVASKIILVLFSDPSLRRKLLGTADALKDVILPATVLKGREEEVKNHYQDKVIKHIDGMGGEMVFMDQDLLRTLKKIPPKERGHWVLQERTKLNTILVNGILSKPRRVISDLGVFVQYDWSKDKFQHFGVGGFITRATNRSFKVNVSGGGIQVPVMFTKK